MAWEQYGSSYPCSCYLCLVNICYVDVWPCLQLFKEGRITATKVAMLKAKYTKMHEALKMLVSFYMH